MGSGPPPSSRTEYCVGSGLPSSVGLSTVWVLDPLPRVGLNNHHTVFLCVGPSPTQYSVLPREGAHYPHSTQSYSNHLSLLYFTTQGRGSNTHTVLSPLNILFFFGGGGGGGGGVCEARDAQILTCTQSYSKETQPLAPAYHRVANTFIYTYLT